MQILPLLFRRRYMHGLVFFAVVALLIVGCTQRREPRANGRRPALAILISTSISDRQITVSPNRIGAGSVEMILANRSRRTRTVTLTRSINDRAEVIAQTRPIEPGQTAHMHAELQSGRHLLRAGDRLPAAPLSVGRSRPSANDELLTP